MSIFRRDQETAPSPQGNPPRHVTPPSPASAASVVAPGSRFAGKISGATRLQVDGDLEGEIHVDAEVVVGSAGKVVGEITGRSVLVAGRVEGNISGLERIEVQASGKVEGDLSAPRVVIAEGAFFKGSVEMGTQEARRPQKTQGSQQGGQAHQGGQANQGEQAKQGDKGAAR